MGFRYVGNKTFNLSVKIRILCPRTTKFSPKLAFLPGLASSFGALLVGWLVVLTRGLYLTRHLFTLFKYQESKHFCLISKEVLWKEESLIRMQSVL